MESKQIITSFITLILVLLAVSRGLESSVLGRSAKEIVDAKLVRAEPVESPPQNIASVSHQSQVNVPTTSGLLFGIKEALNVGNSSIYKFLSVPYAEAPIKSLRFKRPVELNRVDQVIDATKFGKTCPQFRHLTQFISPLLSIDNEHQTSEDCLHLNVFVPSTVASIEQSSLEQLGRLEPSKQLPVIVWIPGEGFDFADARQFDGSHLAHKTQSIVVTVQYRVGILGFLHDPSKNILGNMGIHDQLMALRWVKRNIANFGGDSDRVTLMGRFSGSMSISTIITAPKQDLIKWNGQSLFNRVAMLSGVAVTDWIIDSQQFQRVGQLEASALARGLCNSSQIEHNTCLQDMPIEHLLPISGYGWRLVVDNELIGQLSPIEAVKENQFATNLEGVLMGETGMEGTLCLYRHMLDARNNNYAQLIEEDRLTSNDLYDIIRDDSLTYFRYNLTKTNPIQLALEALAEDQDVGSSTKLREKYLNACSTYMIKSHSNLLKRNVVSGNRLAKNRMNSDRKPVEIFHYELRYKPTFSLAPDYIKTASHGDDIPLIFGLVYNQPKRAINDADLLMTRKMMAMIGNFVHGNNPLLAQHSTIDSIRNNDNDTTSLDESEPVLSTTSNDSNSFNNAIINRSWSNEGQIYPVDLNESDLNELNSSKAYPISDSETVHHNREPKIYAKGDRANIRLMVVEGPLAGSVATNVKAQAILDQLIELLNQQTAEELQQPYASQLTRSSRLSEQHRQQISEDMWIQRRGSHLMNPYAQQLSLQHRQPQPTQTQQNCMTLVTESSFMTMLVFCASIMIFSLISSCLGLFLLIARNTSNKGIKKFACSSSSSACNICNESRGNSIDVALDDKRKKYREFNNVFAKLNNHNGVQSSKRTSPQTCASVSIKQQQQQQQHATNNDVEMLNQRSENGTINEER